MLSIPNGCRNANQNDNGHPMAIIKSRQTTNTERAWKKKNTPKLLVVIYIGYSQYMDRLQKYKKQLSRRARVKRVMLSRRVCVCVCVCDALRGKSSETQALGFLLRHILLYFTAGKPTFPEPLLAPRTRGGHQKVLPPCGHFL